FFYTNTLHRRAPGSMPDPDTASTRAFSSLRAPWFNVSCCPPNIARTIASLASLVATVDDNGLQLHQYATSTITTALPDGTPIGLDVETTYPEEGAVTIRVRETAPRPWTLSLRVPAWANGATLTHQTTAGQQRVSTASGPVAGVTATFAAGDTVTLNLPMTPQFIHADPRIDAIRGCVAVHRGPVVYCAEQPADNSASLDQLVVDTGVAPSCSDGRLLVEASWRQRTNSPWPYHPAANDEVPSATDPLALIPYHDWGQSGLCTMRVWLPTD
ncbi:MAG TPA: glycoside hydrolase family 127 protein, partial [Dermatophilaceae bacterium]